MNADFAKPLPPGIDPWAFGGMIAGARPAIHTPSLPISDPTEDRCAPRIDVKVPVTLRLAGARPFHTVMRDISIAGFRVSAVNRLPANATCWLSVPGLESLQAQIVWSRDNQVGGAFANLLNPIVLDHLIERWQRANYAI